MSTKFKQAIQVGHRDIGNILRLPCVMECRKVNQEPFEVIYLLFGDTDCKHIRWGQPVAANEGDWLCEDESGRWHLLTDRDYQRQAKQRKEGEQ